MALTDTFIRQVKHSGAPAGDKHTDGQDLYLLVKAVGKYWRMNYRFTDQQKTLSLGVYPAVSFAKARKRRDEARELLADGIDPREAKRDDKQAKIAAAAHTFESVARTWLEKTAADRALSTQTKVTAWLEHDVFPSIGKMPISTQRLAKNPVPLQATGFFMPQTISKQIEKINAVQAVIRAIAAACNSVANQAQLQALASTQAPYGSRTVRYS